MIDLAATSQSWLPLAIFTARVADVSIGTLRMICVVRGSKSIAVILSFLEVLIWIFAVSSVLTHLDEWLNIVAYAGGYATGSAVGLWIEDRLALGMQAVSFISRGAAQAVAERLRFADHCVTTVLGNGQEGPVAICYAVIPRRLTTRAIRMASEVDPNVVVTVEDVRQTTARSRAGRGPGKMLLPWRQRLPRRFDVPTLWNSVRVAGSVLGPEHERPDGQQQQKQDDHTPV